MGNRIDLQKKFEDILGSRNVYYQPPESIKMSYPAIVYSLGGIDPTYANNKKYLKDKFYSGMLIDKNPESEFVDKLQELDYCEIAKPFSTNGLNHFPFTIYY